MHRLGRRHLGTSGLVFPIARYAQIVVRAFAGYGRPDGRRGVVIIGRCTRADVAQLCELTSCDYACRSMRARMGSVGGEIGSGCQSRWVDSGRLLVVLAGPGLVCGLEMGEEHQPPLLVRLDVFVGEEAVVDRDEGSAVGWGEGELGSEYEIAIERADNPIPVPADSGTHRR